MSLQPTPVSIIENFFGQSLDQRTLKSFDSVDDDTWVDFAIQYRATMKGDFSFPDEPPSHSLAPMVFDSSKLHLITNEVPEWYDYSPIFGRLNSLNNGPYESDKKIEFALSPIKKHLLMSEVIYIQDNFYRVFDGVAEFDLTNSIHREWKSNPLLESLVRSSIRYIKTWLPILIHIKPLIEARALVFYPYYAVPSFGGDNSPWNKKAFQRVLSNISVPPRPGVKPIEETDGVDFSDWSIPPDIKYNPKRSLDRDALLNRWLDAHVLRMNPIFSGVESWEYAKQIHVKDGYTGKIETSLMGLDINPLITKPNLTIHDILKIRRNEEVFSHASATLRRCSEYLFENLRSEASNESVRKIAKNFILDDLSDKEKLKMLRFIDDNLLAASSTAFIFSLGVSLVTANPWIGAAIPAALTPKLILAGEELLNKKSRAARSLSALL